MVRILVVDDSTLMRKITLKALDRLGYTDIAEADNLKDAITLYKAEKPGLVLLDLYLNEVYCIEALKEIKSFDPDAKVIIMSSLVQVNIIAEVTLAGAKGFIYKPVNEDEVKKKIALLIGKPA